MRSLTFAIAAGLVVAAGVVAVPTALSGGVLSAVPASATAQLAGSSLSASSATTFKNCTALNKKYKHGVGKPGAVDKGAKSPVTNFYVSASL